MADDDSGPPERDVKHFQFKQALKIQVFDQPSDMPLERSSLVAVANHYGFIFVGTPKGFKVLQTELINKRYSELGKTASNTIEDFPAFMEVSTEVPPTHIAVSVDSLLLTVCMVKDGCPIAVMYDTRQFADKSTPPSPFTSVRLGGQPGVEVVDIAWNCGADFVTLMAACMSDGSIYLFDFKDQGTDSFTLRAKLAANTQITCICWSPKGKQLVAGKKDGTMAQYDHDLRERKAIPCPPADVLGGQNMQVLDVHWESSYVFVGAYVPVATDNSDQPLIVVVNVPKNANPSFVVYDDICFGGDEERKRKYYFSMIAEWDMLIAASANSLEAAVLGKSEDKTKWERWNLEDSGRAEAPMVQTPDNPYQETYPIGMTIDYSSQMPIPIGDNKTHPPSPMYHVLTTHGLLVSFYMMNSLPGAPAITRPLKPLTAEGARKGALPKPTLPATPQGLQVAPTAKQGSAKKSLFQDAGSKPASSSASSPAMFSFGNTSSAAAPAATASASASSFTFGGASSFGAATPSSAFSFNKPTGADSTATAATSAPAAAPTQTSSFGFASTSTPAFGGFGGNQAASQASSASTAAVSAAPAAATAFGQAKPQSTLGSGSFSFGATSSTQSLGFATPAKTETSVGAPTSGLFGGGGAMSAVSNLSMLAGSPPNNSQPNQSATPPSSGFALPAASVKPVPSEPPAAIKPLQITSEAKPAAPPTSVPASAVQKPMTGLFGNQGKPKAQAGSVLNLTQQPTAAKETSLPATIPSGTTFGGKVLGQPSEAPAPAAVTVQPAAAVTPQPVGPSSPGKRLGSGKPASSQDNPFMKSIRDEMAHFEAELAQLKQRCSKVSTIKLITPEETAKLTKDTHDMVQFCNDIKKNTKDINDEIHELKTKTLESFATVEECRMRENRQNDPAYQRLLSTRALDPMSERKMKEIRSQYHYVENGIREVDLHLDMEWESYQNRKNKTKRMAVPSVDSIYRTLSSNQRVILSQTRTIDQLESQLNKMRLHNSTSLWDNSSRFGGGDDDIPPSPNTGLGGTNFSSTMAKPKDTPTRLSESLMASTLSPKNRSLNASLNQSPAKSPVYISPEKQAKLREVLGNRRVTPVKSTAPENLSMSKIVSADALKQMLSEEAEEQASYSEPVRRAMPSMARGKENSQPVRPVGLGTAYREVSPAKIVQPQIPAQAQKSPMKPGSEQVMKPVNIQIGGSKLGSSTSVLSPGGKGTAFTALAPKSAQASASQPSLKTGFNFNTPTVPTTKSVSFTNIGMAKSSPSLSKPQASVSIGKPGDNATATSAAAKTAFSFGGSGGSTSGFNFGGNKSANISFANIATSTPKPEIQKPKADLPKPELCKTAIPDEDTGESVESKPPPAFPSFSTPAATKVTVVSVSVTSTTSTTTAPSSPKGFSFGAAAASSSSTGFSFGAAAGSTPSKGFNFSAAPASSGGIFGSPATSKPVATAATVTQPAAASLAVKPISSVPSEVSSSTSKSSGFKPLSAGFNITSALVSSSTKESGAKETTTESSAPESSSSGQAFVSSTSKVEKGSPKPTTPKQEVATSAEADSSKPDAVSSTTSGLKSSTTLTDLLGAKSDYAKSSSGFSFLAAIDSTNAKATSTDATTAGTTSTATAKSSSGFTCDGAASGSGSWFTFGRNNNAATSTAAAADSSSTAVSSTTSVVGSATSSASSGFAASSSLSTTSTTAANTGFTFGSASTSASSLTSSTSASSANTPATTAATVTSTTAPGGIFGSATAASTTGFSFGAFGSQASVTAAATTAATTTATTPASTSAFGSGSSVFGSQSSAPTSSAAAPAPVAFGAASTGTTTASVFGSQTSAATTAVSAATTSAPGLFGSQVASSTATTSATPLFGSQATSSAAPAFGSQAASSTSTTPFGATPAATTFGGQAASSGTSSVFGQPSAGGSIFGTASSTAPSTSSGTFGFGQAAATTASSGFGSSTFGQSSFGQSTFGQTASSGSSSVFGAASSTSSQPAFGGSAFGQTAAASTVSSSSGGGGLFGSDGSSGGGGGLFGGLGGKPSAENANKNVFGSSTFGNQTSQASTGGLFGQTSSTFGSVSTTKPASSFGGSGGFSTGGGSVAAAGFGGFGTQQQQQQQTPQSPGGFGGAPAFGSPAATGGFGSPAAATGGFGSPPAFGGAATFGATSPFGAAATGSTASTGHVFGSGGGDGSAGGGGFASFAQSSTASFGALAQSPGGTSFGQQGAAGGFGSPAQQQPQQGGGFGGFGGNAGGGFGSPAFGGGAGGNQSSGGASFTSYRG